MAGKAFDLMESKNIHVLLEKASTILRKYFSPLYVGMLYGPHVSIYLVQNFQEFTC